MYKRFISTLATAVLCAMAVGATGQSLQLQEVGNASGYFTSAAAARFAIADVDEDGLPDFVFNGFSGGPMLLVFGRRGDGSLGIKQSLPFSGGEYAFGRVLAWQKSNVPHIVYADYDGVAHDFAGWPLAEQRNFEIVQHAIAAAVGDVDADGQDDLLVLTQEGLYSYSMESGTLEWNMDLPGHFDLAIAQLDSDAALEIVLGGAPGLVLDGATHAVDWQRDEGFGSPIAMGRLNGDGTTNWVGVGAPDVLDVFGAEPWSLLWSVPGTPDMSAVATADIDGTGNDVAMAGDGQWGSVHVYDNVTHQERFHIDNSGWGVSAIASADLDGDGHIDIGFTSIQALGDENLMTVADSHNGATEWTFVPATGPYTTVALGDVDGDGHDDVIAADMTNTAFGSVALFDFESGEEKWRGPLSIGNANDPFAITTTRIRLVPHSNGTGADIVLAGTSTYDGRITVIDGTTMMPRLQIGHYSEGPMSNSSIVGLALLDYDGDGTQDFAVAVRGSQGAFIEVYSGQDGQQLWSSPALATSASSTLNDVLAVQTQSGMKLVGVLGDHLEAYNVATGQLAWLLPATNDGAFFAADGIGGPEIAVFLEGGAVTFYDAENQSYLRSFVLDAPLRSVDAIDDHVHALLATSSDRLVVVDGLDGAPLASSSSLGPFSGLTVHPAIIDAEGNWRVAAGSWAGLYRYRLMTIADRIFAGSFDPP